MSPQRRKNKVLGILGGGQLGRMSAMAAARLGIEVIIFCPDTDSPASQVVRETILAPYDDKEALRRFADKVDFISYEFENIPVETVEYLETLKKGSVLPDKSLLRISQDRIEEKRFLNEHGVETVPWRAVTGLDDIKAALEEWKSDFFILKTARFGYDGKGQIKCDAKDIDDNTALSDFLESVKDQPLIMEAFIDFSCEASVIVARDKDGKTIFYGPMLNEHKNHILHKTIMPAGQTEEIEKKILSVSKNVAQVIDLTGVMTLEFLFAPTSKSL